MDKPMDIPEEIWEQDLVPPPHPTPPPEGLSREEPPEDALTHRTRLPHTFICGYKHKHVVVHPLDLLRRGTPRCLLERIVLEWCALEPLGVDGA